MTKYWKIGILVGLLLLLAYFNWSVFQKEQILKNGKFVLLKLAPVDPRSLIQGDYMDLRYECAELDNKEDAVFGGKMILRLDSNHVGTRISKIDERESNLSKYVFIRYKSGKYGRGHIGSESYFFEEGQADLFTKARYGGVMVDDDGNSILIGLYDENLEKIKK